MIPLDPKIVNHLAKNGIPKEEFEQRLGDDLALEMLLSQGMNVILHSKSYKFRTVLTPIKETLFASWM